MRVIGIDADVQRIAYSAWESQRLLGVRTIQRANTKRRLEDDYHSRLVTLMRWAADNGFQVVLEGIYLAEHKGIKTKANVDGFRRLANVQGEIRYEASRCRVPLEVVQPSVWQSSVLGRTTGREELKAASMEVACRYCKPKSEHEADAVCIGLHGIRMLAQVAQAHG